MHVYVFTLEVQIDQPNDLSEITDMNTLQTVSSTVVVWPVVWLWWLYYWGFTNDVLGQGIGW